MPQQDKPIQMPSTTQVQHQLQYGTLGETIPSREYMLCPVNPGEGIKQLFWFKQEKER